jgi:hypothetical protein
VELAVRFIVQQNVEVADILRGQGDRFLERYGKSFDFQQLNVFRAIQSCRTAALGGHVDACPRCGYQAAIRLDLSPVIAWNIKAPAAALYHSTAPRHDA